MRIVTVDDVKNLLKCLFPDGFNLTYEMSYLLNQGYYDFETFLTSDKKSKYMEIIKIPHWEQEQYFSKVFNDIKTDINNYRNKLWC